MGQVTSRLRELMLGLMLLVAACSAYDPKLLTRSDESSDSGLSDADARIDAAPTDDGGRADASDNGCVPSDEEFCPEICPEICNGLDDDCDANIDEEPSGTDEAPLCDLADAVAACGSGLCLVVACLNGAADCNTLPGDGCEARLDTPESCGFCFAACNIPRAVARCEQSSCVFDSCQPGYGNCDGDEANGCELAVDSLTNCGACGVVCGAVEQGQPGCIDGACGVAECDAGFADCDGVADNGCEVALNTVETCGSCTTTCGYDHAIPLCADSSCVPGTCLSGYADCDNSPLNECETNLNADPNNCGGCGRVCDPTGSGGFACVDGQCVVTLCPVGLADCDSDANNGCETPLRTLTDCTGCGIRCQFANADASCATGSCALSACRPGYGNCNNNAADGCEAPLTTDSNCGACGTMCGVSDSRTCSGGVCSLVACGSGTADCNNDGLDCEQSLTTLAHCGTCNARCGDTMGRLPNATASCASGACAVGSCSAQYADCDGAASNGCEASLRTTANCGACGGVCSLANASVSCATGSCAISSCNAGFADCDGNVQNGCETPTNTSQDCGACNTLCSRPQATTSCSSGTCATVACSSGFGDCDGNAANGCEMPLTSSTNCGACGSTCALTNAAESCSTGTCMLTSCDQGFGNCDFIAFNGCEAPLNTTSNCGGCGSLCDYTNASEMCLGGTCTLTGCSAGFGNCDNNVANGCEQSLTNTTHCGGCNLACSRANATATCATGVCGISACLPGFGNCDGNAANGCETQLNTDANCGACGAVCGAMDARTCSGGVCSLSSCPAGTADCDNDGLSCEQSLNTLSHCGGCGVACSRANASATCPSGTCTLGTCTGGFANCDVDAQNGCEQATNTNVHCGGCNVACSRANANASCSSGTCTLGTCNAGFGNCDGNAANGCETQLNTGTHCGACNTACALANAGETCATGSCVIGACDSGFGNCDGNPTNGCEVPLTTTSNCNACNAICDFAGATESCATGTCTLGACDGGFGNCDANNANGCEQALNTTADCGACNTACTRTNASASCGSGTCTLGTCDTGFGNCDGNAANGCEASTLTLTNCGGCASLSQNQPCTGLANVMQSSCGGGVCVVDTCNANFRDCDGNPANGCEVSGTSCATCTDAMANGLETDVDCGGATTCPRCIIGRACTTGADCQTGTCGDGICRPRPQALCTGNEFACAITDGGRVLCWGDADAGELGGGETDVYRQGAVYVSGLTDAVQIACSDTGTHVCAVRATGAVVCWGANGNGRLGDGTVANRSSPVTVPGITTATQVALGFSHSCALLANNEVRCWGQGADGRLGRGSLSDSSTPIAVLAGETAPSGNLGGVVWIGAGHQHTCAVLNAGAGRRVACWGDSSQGQCGDDSVAGNRQTPVFVHGVNNAGTCTSTTTTGCLANAVMVTGGEKTSAAIQVGGLASSWGDNFSYESGTGSTGGATGHPRRMAGVGGGTLDDADWISLGLNHGCGVRRSGDAVCWGEDDLGRLGDNDGVNSNEASPVLVVGSPGYQQTDAGNLFSCGRRTDGTVRCWGNNNSGALGEGTVVDRLTATNLAGALDFVEVDGGKEHSCAVTGGGELYCFGNAVYGALGLGDATDRWAPVRVTSIGAVEDVAALYGATCALLQNGTASCWGYDAEGQLGDGTAGGTRDLPAAVVNVQNGVEITGGLRHSCVLTDPAPTGDGNTQVWCWGYNGFGQLGDNTMTNRPTPVQVRGVGNTGLLTDAVAIGAGWYHTCAVRSNGEVVCWGNNGLGQLGDNTTTRRLYPVTVKGVGNVGNLSGIASPRRVIDGGDEYTCALASNGRAYCWGNNANGEFGTGNTTSSNAPVLALGGVTDFVRISGGLTSAVGHTCAVRANGEVLCAGYNGYGQLGDETVTQRNSAVRVHLTEAATARGNADFLIPAIAVSSGEFHSLAVLQDGSIVSWGAGASGRLGGGDLDNKSLPVQASPPPAQ